MDIISLALVIIGGIIAFIAGIVFLITAFRQGILWGLGCIFLPFVSLFFLIVHWRNASKPFGWYLLGTLMTIVGMLLSPQSYYEYLPY